jgi:cell division protein FtsL
MDRQLIAYLLLGLFVAAAASLVVFTHNQTRQRTMARQDKQIRAEYDRRLADRDDQPFG